MRCTADFKSLFPYENGSKGYEHAEKRLNKFSQEVTGTMQTMASVLRDKLEFQFHTESLRVLEILHRPNAELLPLEVLHEVR